MRATMILIVLLSFAVHGYSDTIKVPGDYSTIQEAINASVNGDTVLVGPGTYVENIDFIGKEIVVKSELGPEVTIIDGNQAGSVVSFINSEGLDTVIEGFSLKNGYVSPVGGGILCSESSSPIIVNNVSVRPTPPINLPMKFA